MIHGQKSRLVRKDFRGSGVWPFGRPCRSDAGFEHISSSAHSCGYDPRRRLRRPMAGATVLAYPGGEAAITDDQGQFKIQSHARVQRLAVFDGLLDRTGMGSLSRVLDTTATERAVITIATPSLATIWARLCPDKVPVRGRDGIVLGGPNRRRLDESCGRARACELGSGCAIADRAGCLRRRCSHRFHRLVLRLRRAARR